MGQDADQMTGGRVVARVRPGETVQARNLDYRQQQIAGSQDRDIAEIKADIRLTRAEMGRTIDEIQQRLEPDRIKRQVGGVVRANTIGRAQDMFEGTRSAGGSVVDRIRQNPIPAAMVAIGLGWLFTRPSDSGASEGCYGRTWDDGSADDPRGRAGAVAGQARDRIDDLTGRAQDRAVEMRENARYQAGRARGGFDQMLADNPLALGAVALAAGAVAGMAAPTTSKEHELMGEARDRLLDQAQSSAQEAVGKAQRVAQEAVSTAKEEARNQGLTS